MNNLDLKKTTENLIETFLHAGKIAREISHRGVKVTMKADNTPVTDGDLEVDLILKKKNSHVLLIGASVGYFLLSGRFFWWLT